MKGNELDSWQTILTVLISSMGGLLTWLLNARKQKDDRSAQLFEDMRADRDGERKRNEDLQKENDILRSQNHELAMQIQSLQIDNIHLTDALKQVKLQTNQNNKI